MKKELNDKLKTLIPLQDIEYEAVDQIERALSRDFMKMMAIMPDVHAGYDLPVGAVALTDGVISPSFVGYDIGCGMCMVDTGVPATELLPDERERISIFNKIYETIPVGFDSLKKGADYKVFRSASGDPKFSNVISQKVVTQLGTLGGGNHFIEIGKLKSGNVSVTIHSGSRNAGHQVCSYYMKKGYYLRLDSDEGKAYYEDMNFMLQYALDNRLTMIKKIIEILGLQSSAKDILKTLINENHNHASIIKEGVIHRKGATPAEKGQKGVIPGNMRDGVYVTCGLGNKEYLESSSHGAGRLMSRKKAKKDIKLKDFEESMKGVTARVNGGTLDEAPFAYKDINDVIRKQQGIVVDIIEYAKPLINIKG